MKRRSESLHKSTRLKKTDIDNLLLQGEILIKLKRKKEAEIVFDKALELETEAKDQLCLDIAIYFPKRNVFDYSIKYLLYGKEINPTNEEILFELAFNYNKKKK
jgi:tetratricopeptide (TPR) repeat protein